MAAVTEDVLKKDLSSGKLAEGYILYGDDAFLVKLYTDRLCAKAYGGDAFFNFQKFAEDCDLQAVYDAMMQYPMMAERKCVLLTDYDFEHAGKNDFDRLCALLTGTVDTCVLILRFDSVEVDPKHSAKAKKLIAAVEKGGGRAVCLNHRTPAELTRVLTDGAAKRGCRMDPAVARYLIETAGNDTGILGNELDKLCQYLPGGTITKETVDRVCVKSAEASVYDLMRRVFAGDLSGALSLLDSLFFMRLEPMIILYTVSSSYVDLFRAAAARRAGVPLPEAAAAFGYRGREFVFTRAAENLRKFDDERLSFSFEALLRADAALKSTGTEPRTVLEELLVRLVYILVKGEAVD